MNFTFIGLQPPFAGGGQVTIGGTTYRHGFDGTLVITLNLVGPTVPYVFAAPPPFDFFGETGLVPFTMTGSFTFDGPGVSLSGQMEGAGEAGASWDSRGSTVLQYTFSSVPEPSAWGLASLGLVAVVLMGRKAAVRRTE